MTCNEFEGAVGSAAERLLPPGSSLLCGVSGGPDSAALAAAMARQTPRLGLGKLRLGHVDHQLRSTSAADARVAAELAEMLDVPISVRQVIVGRGDGPEASARGARYLALAAMAEELGCTHVAVAHTRTDQAETVLLRMLRGSGLAGLAAMSPSRALGRDLRLVRPLLGLARSEVHRYAEERRLPLCEDPTNRDLRMWRNRLRLQAWPALAELSPQLERHLAGLADRCREDDRALEELAAAAFNSAVRSAPSGEIVVDSAALQELPPAIARRVFRRACRRARATAQPTAAQVGRVMAMVESGRAAEAHLSGDLSATLWKGDLVLKPRSSRRPRSAPFSYLIDGEGVWPCPEAGFSLRVAAWPPGAELPSLGAGTLLLARDSLTFPLEVRNRRPGDRFYPSRGPGSRKLKRFLIDEGVARDERDQLALLCSAGAILWVVGLRAGEPARRPASGAPGWKIEVIPQPSSDPSTT